MVNGARAIAVVNDAEKAARVVSRCADRGLQVEVFTDPAVALAACRVSAPDLAIVEEQVGEFRGPDFIKALLAVSWTTSSILISGKGEAVIHNMVEGLGVLGHITDFADITGLDKLLSDFENLTKSLRNTP